jgi:hypothetical protein
MHLKLTKEAQKKHDGRELKPTWLQSENHPYQSIGIWSFVLLLWKHLIFEGLKTSSKGKSHEQKN